MKNSKEEKKTLTSSIMLSCVIDLISVQVPSGPSSEYMSFFFFLLLVRLEMAGSWVARVGAYKQLSKWQQLASVSQRYIPAPSPSVVSLVLQRITGSQSISLHKLFLQAIAGNEQAEMTGSDNYQENAGIPFTSYNMDYNLQVLPFLPIQVPKHHPIPGIGQFRPHAHVNIQFFQQQLVLINLLWWSSFLVRVVWHVQRPKYGFLPPFNRPGKEKGRGEERRKKKKQHKAPMLRGTYSYSLTTSGMSTG